MGCPSLPFLSATSLVSFFLKQKGQNIFVMILKLQPCIKPVNLKGNQPEYSLAGLRLRLKLQSFGHLMQRADSLEKTLMLGKIENRRKVGGRGRDGWMASRTLEMSLSKLWEIVRGKSGMRQSMGQQRVRHDLAMEQQQQQILRWPVLNPIT